MRDDMHDWVLANENMAKALAGQGLPLPVRLRQERRPLRRRGEAADAARGAGVRVAGVSVESPLTRVLFYFFFFFFFFFKKKKKKKKNQEARKRTEQRKRRDAQAPRRETQSRSKINSI